MQSSRGAPFWLAMILLAALTAASLYPFEWGPFRPKEWDVFVQVGNTQGPDFIFNILMMIPYGLLVPLWRWPQPTRKRDMLLAISLGMIVCVGVQIAQLWLPRRSAQLDDGIANGYGLLIGMALFALLRPLAPSADRTARWDGSAWSGIMTLCLLFAGLMLPLASAWSGPAWRADLLALLTSATQLGDPVPAVYTAASLALIALVSRTLLGDPPSRRLLLFGTLLLASAILFDALWPFTPHLSPAPTNWVPFALSGGPEMLAIANLSREMAWSAGLLWSVRRLGLGWGWLAVLGTGFIALCEALQTRIASGYPDVTDVLIMAGLALVLAGLERYASSPRERKSASSLAAS
jgi:VanZ family protein